MAEHSYTDGTCAVCGAADPNAAPEPDENPAVTDPVDETGDEKGGNVILIVIPIAIVVIAVPVVLLIVKKKKK